MRCRSRPPRRPASRAGPCRSRCTRQRVRPRRLPEDAPNILIVLIDDAGPGLPTTFGGEVRTDTLTRIYQRGHRLQPVPHHGDVLAHAGVAADRPQPPPDRQRPDRRAGQRLGRLRRGDPEEQRARRRGAAALRLRDRGVREVAQHPGAGDDAGRARSTTGRPSIGFEYFYGFLAGEASQYEPNLVRNTTCVLPPKTPEEGYHLSEDLADDAIGWLHRHKAFEPDKPFFMYWASGCLHGPHHVAKEWADKYAGKFDDGWDAYRERVFHRAKEMGWIPQDAQLTPRDPTACRPGTTSRRTSGRSSAG